MSRFSCLWLKLSWHLLQTPHPHLARRKRESLPQCCPHPGELSEQTLMASWTWSELRLLCLGSSFHSQRDVDQYVCKNVKRDFGCWVIRICLELFDIEKCNDGLSHSIVANPAPHINPAWSPPHLQSLHTQSWPVDQNAMLQSEHPMISILSPSRLLSMTPWKQLPPMTERSGRDSAS